MTSEKIQLLIVEGENLRNSGNLNSAQQKFDSALQLVNDNPATASSLLAPVETASGYNLFLLNKLDLAETQLKDAYDKTSTEPGYLHALIGEYLSYLSLANALPDQAAMYVTESLKIAKSIQHLPLELSLELMRIDQSNDDAQTKANNLQALAARINQLADDLIKARLQLSLSQSILTENSDLAQSPQLTELNRIAENALLKVINLATTIPAQERLRAEAQANLARLYRVQGKNEQALALIDQTLDLTHQINARELTARLEADKGDILKISGDRSSALIAYEHAANDLNAISADIPIVLPNGRSTMSELTDPVHRKYVDMLLETSVSKDKESARGDIIKAIENMEIIKETDLQDFFLGKCALNTVKPLDWRTTALASDIAIVYPILLPDRIELVTKVNQEYSRYTVNVTLQEVIKQLKVLSNALVFGKKYSVAATQFYDWLVLPIKDDLERNHIKTLIYVPDRELRSIPYGVFSHDKRFLVEDYAVVTMPSLNFQNFTKNPALDHQVRQLIVGLSKVDGPSVGKLPAKIVAEIEEGADKNAQSNQDGNNKAAVITENLNLPGVEQEVIELSANKDSKVLLNNQFTAVDFKNSLGSGNYDKVHIASHGFFGNNAKDSFIMAYDDIVSLADFGGTLSEEKLKQQPVDLITLSACQTAQGNDRMLLGFSGMAVKSNVRAAVGSLWSISDKGTMEFMRLFYDGINKSEGKADALRTAQIAMIKSEKFWHPHYWAPFIITGQWQ